MVNPFTESRAAVGWLLVAFREKDVDSACEASEKTADRPFAGIKVLELCQFIAGPFASQQLADLGAEIIKIEKLGVGDPMRTFVGGVAVPNYSHNFRAINRGKKSLSVDIQTAAGKDIVRRIAADVDVVIENFRPGVLDRLGLGYEALRAENPKLIFCSVAGFAADGPHRDRPSFDTIGQALSGMLYMFTDPENPRMRGPTISDQAAAMFAATTISAALYGRERTGEGVRIDLTMLDASIAINPDAHLAVAVGVPVSSESRAIVSHAMIMRCEDDTLLSIQLSGPEHFWTGLVKSVERPDFATDPRFSTRDGRLANWDALLEELRPLFRLRTRAEWIERLIANDIPCAEVFTVEEVATFDEVVHSGIFSEVEHPRAGRVRTLSRPARINGSRGDTAQAAPLLGEHADQVLARYGYSDQQIAALRAEKAVGPVPKTSME